MRRFSGRSGRSAAVSLIFAISLVPMLMLVGMALDFGFYAQAQSQLDMAADAAAMHAVRIAVQLYEQGVSPAKAQEEARIAAANWFLAQLGNVPQARRIDPPVIGVNIAGTKAIAQVTYNGVIATQFGRLFPAGPPPYPNWPIFGAATAVISTLTYNEFDFLVDDSSSMLIGSNPSDIQTLEALTPCSDQAFSVENTPNSAQPLISANGTPGAYSWYFDASGAPDDNSALTAPNAAQPPTYIPFGYDVFQYAAVVNGRKTTGWVNEQIPPATHATGECWPGFSGGGSECFYAPGLTRRPASMPAAAAPFFNPVSPATGLCAKGGGQSTRLTGKAVFGTEGATKVQHNVPQAPCAFACHTSGTNDDYFGLARQAGVTLRFDDVQAALVGPPNRTKTGGVIGTLASFVQNSGNLNPVAVGVYYFNSTFVAPNPPDPPAFSQNSTTALNDAATAVSGINPPVVTDVADTDTPGALQNMLTIYQNAPNQAGTGTLPTAPKKYLFLITDGVEDFAEPGEPRLQGPLGTLTLNGDTSLGRCAAIKKLGVKIFVLYTTYYPLPNPYYLNNDAAFAEPPKGEDYTQSPIYKALKTCASPTTDPATNPTILEATSGPEIASALSKLLQSALSTPGTLSN